MPTIGLNWLGPCSLKPVRRWVYIVFVLCALTTRAGQLPLTVNEISLMLRAGYSSNSVIKELAARRFVDVVDEAKEKTLANCSLCKRRNITSSGEKIAEEVQRWVTG